MLQFMTILGISTFLSVIAYKIQHEEIQKEQNLNLNTEFTIGNTSELTPTSYLRIK